MSIEGDEERQLSTPLVDRVARELGADLPDRVILRAS